jgi:hypothetical protein
MLSRPPRPIHTGIAICYGKSLLQLDRRCDEALPFLRRAARQCPRDPEPVWADAQTFLAVALAPSGEFAEATEVLRAFAGARLRSPARVGALQAHAILAGRRIGDADGCCTSRYNPAVVLRGAEDAPRWNGVDGSGDVAIIDEQGLGDAVLMARWIPWLIATTDRPPRFYGRASLRRWIEAAGCEFIERPVQANARDLAADPGEIAQSSVALAMSLPHLAKCTSPSDVPAPFAPSALLHARARRAGGGEMVDGNRNRNRVGVCWTSTAANLNKQLRFLPEQFAEIWSRERAIRHSAFRRRVRDR